MTRKRRLVMRLAFPNTLQLTFHADDVPLSQGRAAEVVYEIHFRYQYHPNNPQAEAGTPPDTDLDIQNVVPTIRSVWFNGKPIAPRPSDVEEVVHYFWTNLQYRDALMEKMLEIGKDSDLGDDYV